MNSEVEIMEGNSGQNIIKHEDANLDLYLKIYNKINSKSEEISKSYSENILVKFEDVKQLHNKTLQSIASSHPVKGSLNVRISVSHNEGESDKHNSFEVFEKYNILIETLENKYPNLKILDPNSSSDFITAKCMGSISQCMTSTAYYQESILKNIFYDPTLTLKKGFNKKLNRFIVCGKSDLLKWITKIKIINT